MKGCGKLHRSPPPPPRSSSSSLSVALHKQAWKEVEEGGREEGKGREGGGDFPGSAPHGGFLPLFCFRSGLIAAKSRGGNNFCFLLPRLIQPPLFLSISRLLATAVTLRDYIHITVQQTHW